MSKGFRGCFMTLGILIAATASWGSHQVLATTRSVPSEYATIQAAIDACVDGDSVLVGPGVYSGFGNYEITFGGREIVLQSIVGPDATIIDPGYKGRGFFVHENEGPDLVISGFTVQNGYAGVTESGYAGGAVFCEIASPTFINCIFHNNTAVAAGGAVRLSVSSATFVACMFRGNSSRDGGAIRLDMGAPVIDKCTFVGNFASLSGGGLLLNNAGAGDLYLTNCTIASNECGFDGGGIRAIQRLILTRCIVTDNCASNEYDQIRLGPGGLIANCCLIDSSGVDPSRPREYDEYCLFGDPLFCDPEPCAQQTDGDWTLRSDSPCAPDNSPCGLLIGALDVGCWVAKVGACCLPDLTCQTVTASDCKVLGGYYVGDGVPCVPSPCQPSAVQPSSWGALKLLFR